MLELRKKLNSMSLRELIDVLTQTLEQRDEISEFRRSGLRLAKFVHYVNEPVLQDFVAVADWREPRNLEESEEFEAHFSRSLVQSGTCENCGSDVVSYSKSAVCPICSSNVECT